MVHRIEQSSARQWPPAQLEALFAGGFPAFITADREVRKHIGQVRERFPHLDIMLLDDDAPVAAGWGVPISWSGEVGDLPATFAGVLERALTDTAPDAFVICGGIVHPGRHGSGLSGELVTGLCATAEQHGLHRVVAPLRPTGKHRYPLHDIAAYAGWQRPDGLPLDPWLRLHVRLGAQVLAMAPRAQTMTGTVAEWEGWTAMALPASGDYVVPDGMSVLTVDREADVGTYVEPNIWVRHR